MQPDKMKQELVEQTLNSLDGIQRAEAPAFFYTRLHARLEKEVLRSNSWTWVSKPAFSFVTLALLLVLNIAAITGYLKSNHQAASSLTTGIQAFASEYDLDGSTVYTEKADR